MSQVAFYFGCSDREAGHYLWVEDLTPVRAGYRGPRDWMCYTDGQLTPRTTTKQGAASLHFIHGYTVLSFHDYTGDSRPASSSTFFIPGRRNFETALAAAHLRFPWVFARLKDKGVFEVVERPGNV